MKRLLVWLLPIGLLSCAALLQKTASTESEPAKPRPTVNHALHQERELVCGDCHDPEETGEPSMPKAESCFECHEDLAKENERVRAYFDATKRDDGSYLFERPAYMDDLIVNHKGHAKYEVSCEECHGKPAATAFARPDPLSFMDSCMACHEEKEAANECATCHEKARKDVKPEDHDAAFLRNHGKTAPGNWKKGEGASCAICHEVPQTCNSCHRATKPATHSEAGFQRFHGRGNTDAGDHRFQETSCALCHKEQSCTACHQTEKPRSHTAAFERRLHGLVATVDRQSCQTCHKQDSCVRCHQTARPVSHAGSWGSGIQSHCMGCHDPLPANGCFTCHKNTLGHLQATPLPAGNPHATATDCRTCHMVIPHLDDGGNCRRCHR